MSLRDIDQKALDDKKPRPSGRGLLFGIVDVGTNSVHLLIGRLRGARSFRVLRSEHQATRLGEGSFARGRLPPAAMQRTLVVLRRYARWLRDADVDRVDAVATEAIRQARNGGAFVRAVRAELSLPLRVLSGLEEARLTHIGVRRVSALRGPTALIAIGGGSTQIVCGDRQRIEYAVSVPLGCARLASQFIRHDPPHQSELTALRAHARRLLGPSVRAMRRFEGTVIGSSAMIGRLLHAARRPSPPHPRGPRYPAISRRRLERFVGWLSASTAAQRQRLPRLGVQREAWALPTGIVLLLWMEGCGFARVRSVPGSLREGLMVRAFQPPWG